MTAENLICVIIPTHNRAHYLPQALDSVYRQTHQNFEIIVVDDGGTDNTRELVQRYDSRLRYFYQTHKGVSSARNLGISKANGEFIAFLDDDDLWLPERLQLGIEHLIAHPEISWLCSWFSFIDGEGTALPRPVQSPENPMTLHHIALFTFIHTSSVMTRRKALETVGGFPEDAHVSEDYHTWAKLLTLGKGATLPQALTQFRLHKNNTKLPYTALLKQNTRIIDFIIQAGDASLHPRKTYIENLHRIIADSLSYKRKWFDYGCFKLYTALT